MSTALLLALALCAATAALDVMDLCPTVKKAAEKCTKERGMTMDEFQKQIDKRPVEAKDEDEKCLFKCIMMESKMMDDEGTILDAPENANEKLKGYFNSCRTAAGTTDCDRAFNIHKCIAEMRDAE